MMKMLKKMCTIWMLFSVVSWYLYGLSEGVLTNTKSLKTKLLSLKNGEGEKNKYIFKLIIFDAFSNFKKAYDEFKEMLIKLCD